MIEFDTGGDAWSEGSQVGFSDSFGSASSSSMSRSSSRPSRPDELAGYYETFDDLTGGRVGDVAASPYQALSNDQIRALGGLGATRRREAQDARDRNFREFEADPSMSLFQRQRAQQLADQDYRSVMDSIAAETEAAITQLARQNELDKVEADLAQLEVLADIFFGGKGQYSKSASNSQSASAQESHSTNFGQQQSDQDDGTQFGIGLGGFGG